MANLNKVQLIGRLTRDPEVRHMSNGSTVTTIGFCVNYRSKDQSGNWVDKPTWITVKIFDKPDSRRVGIIQQYMTKGSEVYFEGRLHLEEWDDKNTGQKRQMMVVVASEFQLLGRPAGSDSPSDSQPARRAEPDQPARRAAPAAAAKPASPSNHSWDDFDPNEDDIPF